MRVLWLCNIMLPLIAEQLHMEASNKEGWLSGLADTVLRRGDDNDIELAIAFPTATELTGAERSVSDGSVIYWGTMLYGDGAVCPKDPYCRERKADTDGVAAGKLRWYAFTENTTAPHVYDSSLEQAMRYITKDYRPDVVHCFGTEYPHTLAMCRVFPDKSRILIGIQGLCKVYADAYYADLPGKVIDSVTPRDVIKQDNLKQQREKFVLRGEMEYEAVRLAGNVTGRTPWDKHYTSLWNPEAKYFEMNETLRPDFYTEKWDRENCEPHSVFLSQGDYPIKGLHYMLLALPQILKKYPDTMVYVAGNSCVGDGSVIKTLKLSAYGRFLRGLIGKYHLEEHVCFLGRLNAEQMKRQYLKSNLFVCCSSIENSPNSLGEAMLLGVPCVSADVGGIAGIFTDGEDGILYKGFETGGSTLKRNAHNLAESVIRMFADDEAANRYTQNARQHAMRTHDKEKNYAKLIEIYDKIDATAGGTESSQSEEDSGAGGNEGLFVFVSNYINHHQIPFCNAMYEHLGQNFVFIQTEKMEEERVRMGWQEKNELPYVKYYYEQPGECAELIDKAQVVLFGGVDDESYIAGRLERGQAVIRYSERLYKEGQWKAVSPRGLIKKYHDHTRYQNAPVYLLCAGAYVPSDFHIVRAYSGKMFKWGYFPETRHYDVDKLMGEKEPGTILWAARFLDWKHPEEALICARYLKQTGLPFHMNIVGGGQMQPMVDWLMKEYELSDVVTLLGYKTPDEVRALMEKTDIYLTTSDRKEGWGAVINEAMNSGCAVIADHMMGAAPYLIRHGQNGFVYEDGKTQVLCELVEKLLRDRALAQKLGREAIRTIESLWNAETAAERLLKFCEAQGLLKTGEDTGTENFREGPCSPAEVISERDMLWRIRNNSL